MSVTGSEISAGDVLRAFHHDAPNLFLGAAFVTVGLVSAAFSALRRQHDSLLLCFALFAVLYGLRLWIQAELLAITVYFPPFYVRLRSASDFIIPIPAFLFLRAAGLLGRPDRIARYVIVAIRISLAAATFALGPIQHLLPDQQRNRHRRADRSGVRCKQNSPASEDFVVVRRGLSLLSSRSGTTWWARCPFHSRISSPLALPDCSFLWDTWPRGGLYKGTSA
jgi:sigma-B regulation protein RsbU (phosphoserine phosphatase)